MLLVIIPLLANKQPTCRQGILSIITIEDNGVGIRKVDLQKLFKKFSRIDNQLSASVKGTGLGLYWAKKVLDLHDGTMKVTSKMNVGSTFEICMPNDDYSRIK